MFEKNVDTIRANLDAFNRTGEINTDDLAADFEMRQTSSVIDTAGLFTGREALRDSLPEFAGSFENVRFESERFFIRMCGRGRGSGIEIDNRIAWVFTYSGGKTVRLVVYEERAEALEAVGLRE